MSEAATSPVALAGRNFTLILPETTREGAFHRADEIREAIKKLRILSGTTSLGMVTISAGGAIFPEDGRPAQIYWRLPTQPCNGQRKKGVIGWRYSPLPGSWDEKKNLQLSICGV